MNIENLIKLFFSIAFTLFMALIVGGTISAYIMSKISERKYKLAVIKIISDTQSQPDSDILESIKNTYENYRINGRFSSLSIIEINAKLIAELRDGTYKNYYHTANISEKQTSKLERLNKLIKEETLYSDEKLNSILSTVRSLSSDMQKAEETCGEIKLLFGAVKSFCEGRIFEKQNEINKKNAELKKLNSEKFYGRIGWIVGMISGIMQIISFFNM